MKLYILLIAVLIGGLSFSQDLNEDQLKAEKRQPILSTKQMNLLEKIIILKLKWHIEKPFLKRQQKPLELII